MGAVVAAHLYYQQSRSGPVSEMNRHSTPLVTIGIPTYNRANGYLRATLESALAQILQQRRHFCESRYSCWWLRLSIG